MKQKCLTMVKVMTALVLAVLMMVGSVSNVVGAVIGTAGFDGGTALISSAEKGLEIAENANISENADEADAAEPDLGFEENDIVRGMKDDLAGTGAVTWSTNDKLDYQYYGTGVTSTSAMPSFSSDGKVTFTIPSGGTNVTLKFRFKFGTNNYYMGYHSSQSTITASGMSAGMVSRTAKKGTEYWEVSNISAGTYTVILNSDGVNNDELIFSIGNSSVSTQANIKGNLPGLSGTAWAAYAKDVNVMTESSDSKYYYEFTAGSNGDYYFRYKIGNTNYEAKTDNESISTSEASPYTADSNGDSKAMKVASVTKDQKYRIWVKGNKVWLETVEEKHSVIFSASPSGGGTITPSGSAAVGVTTATTVTAAEKAGYDFSGWTIGSGITVVTGTASGASPSKTLTVTTKESGDYSVTALFTAKPTYPITVMTNSTSLGTAVSSVAYGYEGQTITLTATEDAGTFGTWSVVSGGVEVSGTKTATFTMPANAVSIRANFNLYTGTNTSKYYYDGWKNTTLTSPDGWGYQRMVEGMYNGKKYSYHHITTARPSDSSNSTFTVTARESGTRYVYFWDNRSSYHSWRSGDPYANFKCGIDGELIQRVKMTWISGEGDNNKFWKAEIPSGTSASNRVSKVFFDNGNGVTTEWQDINIGEYSVGDWNSNNNNHTLNYGNNDYSDDGGITMYLWGSPSGTDQTYEADCSTARFGSDIVLQYSDNGNSYTGNSSMIHPKETAPTDYYIIVYYPNTNYGTINGVAANNTNSYPIVVASTTLPMTPDPNAVTVYAKDGTLRGVDGGNEYETFAKYADTKIYDAGGNAVGTLLSKNGAAYSYETYGAVKGETITIETTISNTTATGYGTSKFNELYYVKGFCINGEVPDGTINNSGLSAGTAVDGGTKYTLTYTIPEDLDGNKLEITPIYYTADPNVTTVTFQVIDFPVGEHNWGNTLYVYPFYGKLSGANNAMGAYPGQPMVYYGGQYYIQVPTKSYSPFTYDTRDNSRLDGADNAAKAGNRKTVSVSGMTLHNGYYDILHREIWGLDTAAGQEDDQTQTYDYDDFYKIYNEKGSDNIIFQYKYETDNDNKSDLSSFTPSNAASFTSTFGNGFEYLVDYKGRKVNLFGTVLIDSKLTNNPIYVVSEAGGEKESTGNIAGQFATQWHIFVPSSINGANPTYSKFTVSGSKASIPPSVLLLEDENSFNTTTYPSALDGHSITDWKTYYTNLKKDYKDNPVLITYEKAKNDVTSDKATRNDGRWLFSATGEPISSNIRIDISQDNGEHYYTNGSAELYEDPVNKTGSSYTVPDVSAYFTNMGVNGQQSYSTTLDSDKTYDFTALSNNANYKFMGWYFDNGKKISGSASATTLRNNSYTFVARFMYVNVGTLLLSHVNGKGTVDETDYQGKGNVSIAVTVTDEEGITVFSDTKSGESITIPEDYIESDNNYDVSVTLTATPANNNAPGTTVLTKPSGEDATFFNYGTPSTGADGKTKTYTFGFNVKDDLYDGVTQKTKELVYTSYFIPYTFKYSINFEYNDRFGAEKVYNRTGVLTADEAEEYVYKKNLYDEHGSVVSTSRYLSIEFVKRIAPVVSNFGDNITWNFSEELSYGGETSGSGYVYTVTGHYGTTQTQGIKRNVTFNLPYEHNNGDAIITDGSGTESTVTNLEFIKTDSADNRVPYGEIPKLHPEAEEERAQWVTAPATIKDASDPSIIKNFRYWSIAATSAPSVEVARCYFTGFNFVAYDNYIITAVYGEPIDISSDDPQTYITYLETTRNQYNRDGKNGELINYNKTQKDKAADVLFNDFVLNYSYKGEDLYTQEANEGGISKLGIVIEKMGQLDKSGDTYNTDVSSYVTDVTAEKVASIESAINGTAVNGLTVHNIDKKSLDNKNRIEIFEAYYNAAGWNRDIEGSSEDYATKYTAKKYVYRAFTYMVDSDTGKIYLSDKPAYFIMYDVATATNAN